MPLHPPEPDGKPPRKVDALRGNISRLVNANRDRVAHVESEARAERERLDFRRRLRRLAVRISDVTRAFADTEFDVILQSRNRGDFTVGELFDYLISKLDMNCHGCGYLLRGLPASGNCPECGARYFTGVLEMADLAPVLAESLKMAVETISDEVLVLSRLRELCAQVEEQKLPPLKLDE